MNKITLLPFLLLSVLFLVSCSNDISKENKYVKIKSVGIETFNDSKCYPGYIDRGKDVNLSFSLSGPIKELNTFDGEYVKKGKLLARIDNDEYKLQIEKAKNELNDAIVKYERAKSYFERISKLYTAGGISYNDWESAQTNLKSSVNQIAILKDALLIAENKETFANIYAPADGIVIDVLKDNGQYVSMGDTVIYFQGTGSLEAKIFIPESDINSISRGQKVLLKSRILKNKIEGYVKSFVLSGINNGSFETTVSIPVDYPELKDGMSVSVEILPENLKKGIFIPLSSVVSNGLRKYVFTIEKTGKNKGIARKREIETGKIYGNKILILKGLVKDELIVVEGTEKISEEDMVLFYE